MTALAAQAQFADLTKRALPAGRTADEVVAFADVDRDGDVDLILGELRFFPGVPLRLLLNDGNGRFDAAPPGSMPVQGTVPEALVTGDVDGDLDVDLIIGNGGTQNRLLLNDGSGRFSDATASGLPAVLDETRALVLVDVDRDLDLDLVVGNDNEPVGLYLNDGGGRFTAGAALPQRSPESVASIAAGDVDGDSFVDLVIGNNGGQNRLLTGDGAGGFSESTLPPATDFTTSVVLVDVDGDTDLDLIVANWGERNRLLLNDGTGTFSIAANALPVENAATAGICAADLDGDLDADLVLGNWGEANAVLINDGSGRFTVATAFGDSDFTNDVAAADIDADGDLDVLCANGRSLFSVSRSFLYVNDGSGAFTNASAERLPVDDYDGLAVAVVDVDRDGDLDAVIGNAQTTNRLCLNDGMGRLSDAPGLLPPDADTTQSIAVGDVDRDGDDDLVFGNSLQNRLLLNDGTGRFVDATGNLPADSDDTSAVLLFDVDGDGDLDLFAANWGVVPAAAQQNRLLLNDGSGRFTDVTATHLPQLLDFSSSAAFGDVDGDLDPDLVVGNWAVPTTVNPLQPTRLYLNDGTGRFSHVDQLPVDNDATADLTLVDVDRDQDLDLAIVNSGARCRLYLNDGAGRFTDATATHVPPTRQQMRSVAAGDLGGDGWPELVIGVGGGHNLVFENDGTGRFSDVSRALLPDDKESTQDLALADFDLDGDLDLLAANRNRQQDSLYLNLYRQIETPHLARLGLPFTIVAHARLDPACPGASVVSWLAVRTLPTPVVLPPFGVLRIDPAAMVVLPTLAITPPATTASLVLPLPGNPIFAGAPLYVQSVILPNNSVSEARLTNLVFDVSIR